MNFYKSTETHNGLPLFVLEEGDHGLAMTREEAEELFVMIGHVLQDDDIERFADEALLCNDPTCDNYNDGSPCCMSGDD